MTNHLLIHNAGYATVRQFLDSDKVECSVLITLYI